MGRPPIGKVAMTNTERSRRLRARLAKREHPDMPTAEECDEEGQETLYGHACELVAMMTDVTRQRFLARIDATKRAGPATKPEPDGRDEEIARLKAEKAALQNKIAELGRTAPPSVRPGAQVVTRKFASRSEYRDLQFCLHPDTADNAGPERRVRALRWLIENEHLLVDETIDEHRRKNREEEQRRARWQAADAKARAERKAAREQAAARKAAKAKAT